MFLKICSLPENVFSVPLLMVYCDNFSDYDRGAVSDTAADVFIEKQIKLKMAPPWALQLSYAIWNAFKKTTIKMAAPWALQLSYAIWNAFKKTTIKMGSFWIGYLFIHFSL